MDQLDAERRGDGLAPRVNVDELQPLQRKGTEQRGNGASDHAGPHHSHSVTESRRCVPQRVDRGLGGAGQRGPTGRYARWKRSQGVSRDHVAVLVWKQTEHVATNELLRTLFDNAHGEVPVLHRARQVAFLEGRTHGICDCRRDSSGVTSSSVPRLIPECSARTNASPGPARAGARRARHPHRERGSNRPWPGRNRLAHRDRT